MQPVKRHLNVGNKEKRILSANGGFFRDLRGKRFGILIAVHPVEQRDCRGNVIWACICECKNITYVTEDRLTSGNTKSCGCLKEKAQSEINTRLHFIDGTCVEWIEKRKHRSDNTSGFRGVYKRNNESYRVGITLKGKRHHVGTFKTFEEAVKARLEAEEQLYRPFLEEYYATVESEKETESGILENQANLAPEAVAQKHT